MNGTKIFEDKNLDQELIRRAYDFGEKAHKGQLRKSGEPYFNHCLETAKFLYDWGLDSVTIAAGLLHDTLEDTNITPAELKNEFGEKTFLLVEGISKIGQLKLKNSASPKNKFVENLRKMFLVMSKDVRVVFIKLADRLHNMLTIEYLPEDKQKRIARETLEIFAPLAERLGMGRLKGDLEDLCFAVLYPEEYQETKGLMKGQLQNVEKTLQEIEKTLRKKMEQEKIEVIDMHHRVKRFYSLYCKLRLKDSKIEKIYDLVALRVIVKKKEDCYAALGAVHSFWKPLIGRIKDYIAQPKPNGYQSLHTTVFGPEGYIVEIQIRTRKMHEEAEYGLVAHWHYKSLPKIDTLANEQIKWVKRLATWQKQVLDDKEFLRDLKTDVFNKRIFVFTPKGDCIDLPLGATPIDFAYQIHTELGDSCNGAEVDGKWVSLNYELQNGQVVKIISSKQQKNPRRDWLEFVKTSKAKSRIKQGLGR